MGICENCLNRLRCIIDSSVLVQRCAMYQPETDYSQLFDQIAEKIADKIIERLALKND